MRTIRYTKLANKLYLFSIGLYAAIASVFGWLYIFYSVLGLNQLASIFIGYFITVLWRSFYDQLIIYELKIEQLNIKNNFILATIGAFVLAVLYYFIKPLLGDWSVPVTVLIAMRIMGQLKNLLWPNSNNKLPDFFVLYSQKLQLYIRGLYGFFIGIALITYQSVKLFGTSYFYFAFAFSILVGLLFEQFYDLIVIYKIKPTKLIIAATIVIAVISSISCSVLIFILMQFMGFSGKAATIFGIIVLKLLQPLILNLLLKSNNKLGSDPLL